MIVCIFYCMYSRSLINIFSFLERQKLISQKALKLLETPSEKKRFDIFYVIALSEITVKVIRGLGLWCLTPLSTHISVILWQSVLLVEETGVPGENHLPE